MTAMLSSWWQSQSKGAKVFTRVAVMTGLTIVAIHYNQHQERQVGGGVLLWHLRLHVCAGAGAAWCLLLQWSSVICNSSMSPHTTGWAGSDFVCVCARYAR
jgi:hypothetical protein